LHATRAATVEFHAFHLELKYLCSKRMEWKSGCSEKVKVASLEKLLAIRVE